MGESVKPVSSASEDLKQMLR